MFRRTLPRRAAPPSVARPAAAIVAALAKKTRYADPALCEQWEAVAGADLAALGRPGRISGRPRERALEVFAPSGAAAAELQAQAETLLARVNRYFGPGDVARIVVRQRAEPTEKAADEADPLEGALASFFAAVRKRE